MRLDLLIASTLAAHGCAYCPSAEPFTFDEDLSEQTVMDLLQESGETEVARLVCDEVCEARYSGPLGSIEDCELTIDGELTGDADAIAGTLHCEGHEPKYACSGGRRPLGHVDHPPSDAGLPGFLAHGARLEAASVLAFSQLADRLLAWRAPAELVARCRDAAVEEAEHATMLGALARKAGATVEPATQREVEVDLACAALDNAIEGCVYEAWSALCCAMTARRGGTDELRGVYARLAADEARHAQLAWDLHTWFMGQVLPDQHLAIVAAQRRAIAGLSAVAGAQSRIAPAGLGLPGAGVAASFAAGLARAV